jgi:DNA invertase Pin-like site-specific DNA recombinase
VLAEFERELIAERTCASLAARARGRQGGRPRKMDRAVTAMADSKAAEVARRLGITTTTLYVYINGDSTVKGSRSGRSRRPPRGVDRKALIQSTAELAATARGHMT